MELGAYLKKRYRPRTVAGYLKEIGRYLDYHSDAENAFQPDVLEYIGFLRKRYSNPGTIRGKLNAVKVYYHFLIESGKRKDHPAASIRLRDKIIKDIQLQDLLSREELENLLGRGQRYNTLAGRNQVLMSLLVYQALLPGEISALKVSDINLERGSLYVSAHAKTVARELGLKPVQVLLFHQYLQEARPQLLKRKKSDVFLVSHRGTQMSGCDISHYVQRNFKNVYQNKKVSCTSIRQSVIAGLLKQGRDVRMVQVFAGHACTASTEKYQQSQVEELQNQINQYHPFK